MESNDGYVVLVIAVSVGRPADRTINDSLFGSVDGSLKDTPFDNWSGTAVTVEQRFNVSSSTG
jgi:hypothetical protein